MSFLLPEKELYAIVIKDSVYNTGAEPPVSDADTIPKSDTIIPLLTGEPHEAEELKDTIPPLYESQEEQSVLINDTITGEEIIPEPKTVEKSKQPESVTPKPQKAHPDSIYTVEVDPEHFEKHKIAHEKYEPAADYFGSHYLEPQHRTIKIDETPAADWMFPILVASLFLAATTKYFFYNRLKQIISAAIAARFFNQMEREGNLFDERITFYLSANFIIVFSVLVYQTLEYLSLLSGFSISSPLKIILISALVIFVFFVVKYYFLMFLGWVFKTTPAAQAYFKNIIVYNMLIGAVVLPFVFIYVYLPLNIFIFCSWGIFVMANLFKAYRGITIGYNMSHFSGYYLILYLCGVELVPLLLIFKFFVD